MVRSGIKAGREAKPTRMNLAARDTQEPRVPNIDHILRFTVGRFVKARIFGEIEESLLVCGLEFQKAESPNGFFESSVTYRIKGPVEDVEHFLKWYNRYTSWMEGS